KTRLKPLKAIETYAGRLLDASDYQEVEINTEDHANVLLRFDNGNKGVITVNQVAAGRKNRLNIEISGSKSNFEWCSERPNEMWIGRREAYNQQLLKDPGLFTSEAAGLISFPGGHNEGVPDTSQQLLQEVYAAIREGAQPAKPSFPTFADGLRELIICERTVETNKNQDWVKIYPLPLTGKTETRNRKRPIMLDSGEYLRNQLARQVLGGNAFQKVEQVLDLVAYEQIGKKISGLPYSFWQQLEHMR